MYNDLLREVAALVCVVALTLIGTSFVMIPSAWKRFEEVFIPLESRQRRQVIKGSFALFLPLVILAVAYWLAGVYAPGAIQPIMLMVMVLIIVVMFVYSLVLAIVHWVSKAKPNPKVPSLPLMYLLTLYFLSFGIFCSMYALIGVSQTMLDIQVGPYILEDFNSGRWLLLDGIIFFAGGIWGYWITYLDDRTSRWKKPSTS